MKLILQYFNKYRLVAMIAPLMMLLEVFMDLMLPAVMARIVDEGIVMNDLSLVLASGGRMVLYTALALVGGAACSALSSIAATGLGADLRSDLYAKIMDLSHGNIDRLGTGNLITRLTNDVTQLEEVSRMMLRIRAPLQIIGSLVMGIIISRRLSTLFVVFVPLLVLVIAILVRISFPLFLQVQQSLDLLNTRLKENLSGKRLIKAFVREEYESEKFNNSNESLRDITVRATRAVAFMNPAAQILLNAGILAALWYGAKLVDFGALQIGALIAFINYLRQLLFSLMMFSDLVMRFSRAQASALRIREILESEPDVEDRREDPTEVPPKPQQAANQTMSVSEGKIEFKDVTFSYNDRSDPVLKNISFTVNPGETIGIIGATGSGKSTLMDLIPRFYDIDSGSILLNGRDISSYPLKELRRRIAVVSQKTILFSGSVRENILFHYDSDKQSGLDSLMKESASTANISSFIEGQPESWNTEINQRGVNFSGGQKQRISIARALSKRAPVVILDDATSAVDMETERKIYSALKSQGEERTLLIVTQRISGIIDADRILVLDDGCLAGSGTHEELLAECGLYREIYSSQISGEVQP
ncbi:MAG: ABC transporter ATP-binding protein [Spirochaetales bacterium]|nr:ABC transporter ATP-binding protein [Spirochaetales bacterium]